MIAWKIAHISERLASFGYNISVCLCSSPVESLQHLFPYCALANGIPSWVRCLVFNVSPLCPLLVRQVLFGFSEDELRVVPRFFINLINVVKLYLACA